MTTTKRRNARAGIQWLGVCLGFLWLGMEVFAQEPVKLQLFLPNGALPEQEIRLVYIDPPAPDKPMMTESRGRFGFPAMPTVLNPEIRILGEKRGFETERVARNKLRGWKLVPLFLQPAKDAIAPPKESLDLAASDAKAPEEARAALERARKFLAENNALDAVAEFTEALTRYPRYLRALHELGELFLRMNLRADAVDVYQYARNFNRGEPILGVNLAVAYRGLGQEAKAQEVLDQVLKDHPDSGRARFLLAEILMNARQYDGAVEQLRMGFNDASLDRVSRASGLTRLGYLYLREERNQAALRELQKAAELDPASASTRLYMGTALVNLNRVDEAEVVLRKAYELGGARVALALLVLGELYYNTKRFDLALPAFEQYLKDIPSATNAAVVRGYIDRIKTMKK